MAEFYNNVWGDSLKDLRPFQELAAEASMQIIAARDGALIKHHCLATQWITVQCVALAKQNVRICKK